MAGTKKKRAIKVQPRHRREVGMLLRFDLMCGERVVFSFAAPTPKAVGTRSYEFPPMKLVATSRGFTVDRMLYRVGPCHVAETYLGRCFIRRGAALTLDGAILRLGDIFEERRV